MNRGTCCSRLKRGKGRTQRNAYPAAREHVPCLAPFSFEESLRAAEELGQWAERHWHGEGWSLPKGLLGSFAEEHKDPARQASDAAGRVFTFIRNVAPPTQYRDTEVRITQLFYAFCAV